MNKPSDLVPGTLDMLLLKILTLEPMIGFAVSLRLRKANDIQEPAPPTIHRDPVQKAFIGSQLAARTSIAPDAVAGVPIERIMTMNEQIDASIGSSIRRVVGLVRCSRQSGSTGCWRTW